MWPNDTSSLWSEKPAHWLKVWLMTPHSCAREIQYGYWMLLCFATPRLGWHDKSTDALLCQINRVCHNILPPNLPLIVAIASATACISLSLLLFLCVVVSQSFVVSVGDYVVGIACCDKMNYLLNLIIIVYQVYSHFLDD